MEPSIYSPDKELDCSVCGGVHSSYQEALTCVGSAWHHQNVTIQRLKAYIQDLETKLDTAGDIIWDEAIPYAFDVEHVIACHADTLPERYTKLAAAIDKLQLITNFRPDPEEQHATSNQD